MRSILRWLDRDRRIGSASKPRPRRAGAARQPGKTLPSRPKFQACQPGRDTQTDLPLHAERLQRDRIRRAAHQHIAAEPDAERRAALRAGIIAREIARPEPRHRRVSRDFGKPEKRRCGAV
jgi:hypothetical protein